MSTYRKGDLHLALILSTIIVSFLTRVNPLNIPFSLDCLDDDWRKKDQSIQQNINHVGIN